MAQFYYVKDGQKVGPLDFDQLAQQGLTPETLVWTEGMDNWAPAAQIPALASIFAPKPEPAPAPAPAPQPVQQPAPQPQPVQQPQPQYQAPQPQYQQPQPQYQQPQYQQPYQQAYQQQPAGNYVATPQLGFVDAIKRCLSKYADFNGRARRSEFWWFWLACYLLNFILYIPVSILMSKKTQLIQDTMYGRISFAEADAKDPTTLIIILCIIMGIVGLALLIPQLSAMCRRLHDVGKSGHMMWLILVCGIGGLVPLIMCIPDGKPEPNQYGESPKYVLQQ